VLRADHVEEVWMRPKRIGKRVKLSLGFAERCPVEEFILCSEVG